MKTLNIVFDNLEDEAKVELDYINIDNDMHGAWDNEYRGYEVEEVTFEIQAININNMGWCNNLNSELYDMVDNIINDSYLNEVKSLIIE